MSKALAANGGDALAALREISDKLDKLEKLDTLDVIGRPNVQHVYDHSIRYHPRVGDDQRGPRYAQVG
jgi:hypothetical protein